MPDSPTGERRDTYDSRRIDGLEASFARIDERLDNMRERLDTFREECNKGIGDFRTEFNRERELATTIQREATAAARSLRNSIISGCAIVILVAIGERVLG